MPTCLALVVAASLLIAAPTTGQLGPFIGIEEAELSKAGPPSNDVFGYSAALSGDTAVMGAFFDDGAGVDDAGAAYVFVRGPSGWSQQAQLVAADAGAGDGFGISVAISGDTILVGAYDDNVNGEFQAGSAYVFVRDGTNWMQQAKLSAPVADASDHFGYSVGLAGDSAVVGVPGDSTTLGSAHIFVRDGESWSHQAQLVASFIIAGGFGMPVAISGNTVMIGAQTYTASGQSAAGAVYVFDRNETSWTQQAILTAAVPATAALFGCSVAIAGDTAVIGAYGETAGVGANAGAAHVFERTNGQWVQQATLVPSDLAAGDYFGLFVAVEDNLAVVAANGDDHSGSLDAGSAYVFVRDGTSWSEQTKLVAANSLPGDSIGYGVAIAGDSVLVGAPEKDQGTATSAGAAYVFRLTSIGTWTDHGLGLAGTVGVPILEGTGYLYASSPLTLLLSHAKPFSLAPLVVGISALNAPFKGGVMVPNPDLLFPLFTDFFGEADLSGLWPPGIPSSFTIYFQWWIQDPAAPQGFAASNAVSGTTP